MKKNFEKLNKTIIKCNNCKRLVNFRNKEYFKKLPNKFKTNKRSCSKCKSSKK